MYYITGEKNLLAVTISKKEYFLGKNFLCKVAGWNLIC